ncbi:MAG: DUF5320 domain-containing protein [Desulfobacterales bacterium]
MPGYDRTGPRGMGSMTGGGFGFCNSAGGFRRQFLGRGYGQSRWEGRRFGRGFGPGRGINCGYTGYEPPIMTKEQEIEMLKAEAKNLEGMMKSVAQRIETLEKNEG